MKTRTWLFFWVAVAASTFLLGGALATYRRVSAGGGATDIVFLIVTVTALAGSLFVAGRIVRAVARFERRNR